MKIATCVLIFLMIAIAIVGTVAIRNIPESYYAQQIDKRMMEGK
jgi:hypothetical protein